MANTLTGLIAPAYEAMQVVSREMVGFIPVAMRDAKLDRAALNQELRSPVAPTANVSDISAAMQIPETTDQTFSTETFKITKSRAAEFGFTGDETGQVDTGVGIISLQANMIAQAIRSLVNEIETDLAKEAFLNASRAAGVAGTTPFASNLGDSANTRKILDDNGAPNVGRALVISTTTGAKIRTLTNLTRASEAGTATLLRQGVLLDIHGFAVLESGQAQTHDNGTGSGYLINKSGGHAVGDTTLTVDSGSGTIKRGDVINIAGDDNKYIATADKATGTTSINIQKPGLREAAANNAAITIGGDYTANVGLSMGSLALGLRAPELPIEGDAASDRQLIQDPRSGLVLELSVYPGYRKNRYEVAAAWGVKCFNPEHVALLLG